MQRTFIQARMIMTPTERAKGRYMRAPDGHDGSSQQGPLINQEQNSQNGENNSGGNSGQSNGESKNQNNSGDDFDPVAFWETGDGDGDSTGKPDAAGTSTPSPTPTPTPSQSQDTDFGTQLVNEIKGLKFDPVMTEDIAKQINEGDFKGFNEAVETRIRDAVMSSMQTSVKLLRKFSEASSAQMEKMINERLTGERQSDALVKAIPSASNPKVGPAIRAIYEQALTKSKGDTGRAIKATKAMMATLAGETATDLDLDVAPRDPHSNRSQPPKTDWLEELTGRK